MMLFPTSGLNSRAAFCASLTSMVALLSVPIVMSQAFGANSAKSY
jgi:hypothetical protein